MRALSQIRGKGGSAGKLGATRELKKFSKAVKKATILGEKTSPARFFGAGH
jgi:hypothetical protein